MTKRIKLRANHYIVVGVSSADVSGSVTAIARTNASWKKVSNQTIEILAASAATPTLTASTGALSGFTYAEGSGPSNEVTFTVSGDDLTANAIITPPTNYEVSLSSGSGFGATAAIGRTGGDLVSEPRTVYVRLKTGLSAGTYNSGNIVVSSTGATSLNLTVSGTVTATPTLTTSIGSLSNMGYLIGNGPGAEQSFTLTGQNLTGNTTLTVASSFEIRPAAGSTFGQSLSLSSTGYTETIVVRMAAGNNAGGYFITLFIASPGAANANINLLGDVSSLPYLQHLQQALVDLHTPWEQDLLQFRRSL
jgi:hypothetical protein